MALAYTTLDWLHAVYKDVCVATFGTANRRCIGTVPPKINHIRSITDTGKCLRQLKQDKAVVTVRSIHFSLHLKELMLVVRVRCSPLLGLYSNRPQCVHVANRCPSLLLVYGRECDKCIDYVHLCGAVTVGKWRSVFIDKPPWQSISCNRLCTFFSLLVLCFCQSL